VKSLLRNRPKTSQSNVSSEFLNGKELDPDFVDFNSVNRRYHYPARTYVPFRGAFVQVDPLHIALPNHASFGMPAYLLAMPVTGVDPTGRKLVVKQNPAEVEKLLNELCADGKWKVVNGQVTPSDPFFCQPSFFFTGCDEPPTRTAPGCESSSMMVSCCCICSAINNTERTITIEYQTVAQKKLIEARTDWADRSKAYPNPATGAPSAGSNSTVVVAPGRSKRGADIPANWFKVAGVRSPFFMIFAHELCGHAVPGSRGGHGGEDEAVTVENLIRQEHGYETVPLHGGGGELDD